MADAVVESAPGEDNDDSWLYGDGPGELREGTPPPLNEKDPRETGRNPDLPDKEKEKEQDDNENEPDENDDSHFNDEHFADVGREEQDKANGDAASQGPADSDSDDSDDVKVTIGDIKSGPQAYASLNIKRGVGLVAGGAEKARGPTPGKVTIDDLETPGSINGVPALEFNIDTIEDKPWNKPGADISDYFNYGFNEVTWSTYCERQRRMRVNEAGVALLQGAPPRAPPPDLHRTRPAGPPRNDECMQPPMGGNYQVRENTIQVMTAERREYGRAHRDGPPPDYFAPPPDHYFVPPHAHQPFDEPWGHPEQSGWAPSDIKELTPGPMGPPAMGPPPGLAPPGVGAHMPAHLMSAPYVSPYRPHPPPHVLDRERTRDRDRGDRGDRDRDRDRDDRDRRDRDRRDDEERDRERERSRSIKPDRIREKSYRRERSRSRSRRHKSRSRSPRLRERSRDRERERERSRERDRSRDRERSVKPKSKESKEKEEDK